MVSEVGASVCTLKCYVYQNVYQYGISNTIHAVYDVCNNVLPIQIIC